MLGRAKSTLFFSIALVSLLEVFEERKGNAKDFLPGNRQEHLFTILHKLSCSWWNIVVRIHHRVDVVRFVRYQNSTKRFAAVCDEFWTTRFNLNLDII
jgi:hypothetical protein